MNRLLELQRDFAAALTGRRPEAALAIAAHAVSDAIAAEQRAQVYANHFRISLIDALAATYPVTRALVGEAFFAQAARSFVLAEPPRSPRLYEYGAGFPDWLKRLPDLAGHAYLPCVAAFEWATNMAYHADDAPPLDPARLGEPAAVAARMLALHPTARRLSTPWPVSEIWDVHQPGAADVESIDLNRGGEELLIWRQGIDVCWRKLSPAEARLIDALSAGMALGAAAAEAAAAGPLDFAASFAWMLEGGVFRDE